jgi:hypothetical protein
MRFKTAIFSACILFASCLHGQDFKFTILPEQKLYKVNYADALSHQFSISKHFENSEWFANIGGNIPIFDILYDDCMFQTSVGATVFNTIIKTPGHIQVFTADYLADIFIDTKLSEDNVGRFVWGHLSAHYSDDGIIQLHHFPINYVRDYIGLHFQHIFPSVHGKIYLGGFYMYHNEPNLDNRTSFQFGGDAGIQPFTDVLLYAAADIKIKSEVNNGTTQSFQVGIKYPMRDNRNTRLAFTHRRGFEERGQLFSQADIKNSLGIYLDF